MRHICLSFLFLVLSTACLSQISGYLGKRFIVHADLTVPLLERGYHIGAEYAFTRKIGMSMGFSQISRTIRGTTLSLPGEKITFSGQQLDFTFKRYFIKAFTAPRGGYLLVHLRAGQGDVEGLAKKTALSNPPAQASDLLLINITNVNVQSWGLGMGYQYMFNRRFTFDASFRFGVNNLGGIPDEKARDAFQEFAIYNQFSFTNIAGIGNRLNFYGRPIGLSGFVSIGYLLF
ncbi:MAG: hypothetical protein AAFY71_26775 [Bacteroidota bacterium]